MRMPEDMKTGTIHKTNNCGLLKISNYKGKYDVDIEFLNTGSKSNSNSKAIRKGNVRDAFMPVVYNIGFIGHGNYKSKTKGKQTKAYMAWNGMLSRCYSEAAQERRPTYQDCTVHPEWHNFQNFAQWYHDNYPSDGGDYHLDKDIKIEGNKEYSPSACIFVSPADNAIKARAKSYTFIGPNGDVVDIYNLNKFCKDNNLTQSAMSAVSNGKAKQHKGWRLA